MAFLPHPAARWSFIRARWLRQGSIRCRRSTRRTSRAVARMRTRFPGVFAAQGRQLYELNLRQPCRAPEDGVARPGHDACQRRQRAADRRRGLVEIYNARGKIRLRARIDGSVPAGVVAASLNWNKLSSGGNNVNALTSERLTDLGRGATFYSTLVEVRKLSADEAQKRLPSDRLRAPAQHEIDDAVSSGFPVRGLWRVE